MTGQLARLGVSTAVLLSLSGISARADEADAKRTMKAMSNYVASQSAISFKFDTNLEIVSKDHQKVLFASSGTIDLNRPDKIRATRKGGFANVEVVFDGTTLTVFDRLANAYAQAQVPGSIDHLIDELREKYHRPVPGADLLSSDIYGNLMPQVTDVKDLGSGVIGGTECDHFAFRTQDVDWQIWIAQGDKPYPCRYIITAKQVDQAPQYSVQISDWKTGSDANFQFTDTTNARKIDTQDLGDTDELPNRFRGGSQ